VRYYSIKYDTTVTGIAISDRAHAIEEHPDGKWVRREDYDALLPLARFGRWCLGESRGSLGDIDGASAQDKACELGLLAEVTADKPCSEDDCTCAEYYATDEWPVQCLRETDAAKVLDPTTRYGTGIGEALRGDVKP
jgi:hypothetical protein